MPATRAASHGTSLRCSGFGGFTTVLTLTGFRVMRSSAMAALRIIDRVVSTSLMWEGASGFSAMVWRPRIHAWITLGLRASSASRYRPRPFVSPRSGRMWSRT